MARQVPPERLGEIARAGTAVFGKLGYKRARMADVATEAGLSSGAVYTYVDSKEALFHLVFAMFFGLLGEGEPRLPLSTPPLSETLEVISRGLKREVPSVVLRAALHVKDPPDVRAELEAIVEEQYAMTERLWPVLAVIERCSEDIAELREFYFDRRRAAHQSAFARYLQLRVDSGHLEPFVDTTVAAQVAVEAITWFAWHCLEGFDAGRFDRVTGHKAVIEFVCDGLVRRR